MASRLSTRSQIWGLAVLVALFTVATSAFNANTARAEDDVNYSSWEMFKAPPKIQIVAYTTYLGTKNDVTNKSLDLWTGIFTVAGEVAIPGVPLSFFGDVKYQYVGSASTFSTGWSDAHLGAKLKIFGSGTFALCPYIYGTIPIGAKKVKLADFSATNLGLSLTVAPINVLAINAWADFGAVWELQTTAGNVDAVEARFGVEVAVTPPIVQGRIGITGLYRDKGVDKSAFAFYAEVNLGIPIFTVFLRATIPFDIKDGIAGLQQGYDTGEILFTGGLWFKL